jgi:hypothetical protein
MPENPVNPEPARDAPEPAPVVEQQVELAPETAEAPAPNFMAETTTAMVNLLTQAGVQSVVFIDDEFATDHPQNPPNDYFDVLTDNDLKDLAGFSQIATGLPYEALVQRCKEVWPTLRQTDRTALYGQLHALAGIRNVEPTGAKRLAGILGKSGAVEVVTLSWTEWRTKQGPMLTSRFDGKFTLLLIDQDFSKEGGSDQGGTDILTHLQQQIPDGEATKLRCALLTQRPLIREEHHTWNKFAIDKNLTRSRFMLISKERLGEDQFPGFVMMLRLTLLNPLCESLRKEAEAVYQTALDEAKLQVAGITIYDVEQIVFASSRKEGVWEPDTLFRILGMYLRREARKEAASNDRLRKLADEVRAIAGPSSLEPTPKQEGTKALEIRQIELYEDATYLNKHFSPIDLGDIFEVARGPGAPSKQYILLAQPCDMMVRHDDPKGERKHGVTEGVLLEVLIDEPPVAGQQPKPKVKYDPILMYRLDYYKTTGEHAYVDFSTARGVNLTILDLCAMREDGKAELEAFDRTTKEKFIPSWKSHNDNIRKKLQAACQSWQKMTQACAGVQAQKDKINGAIKDAAFGELFGPNLWIPYQPHPISDKGNIRIAFQCKRIRRLNQPWAGAMLTAYTQYLSRAAFEHDYGSIGFDASHQPAGLANEG